MELKESVKKNNKSFGLKLLKKEKGGKL